MLFLLMKIALLLPGLAGLSLSHVQDLAPRRMTSTPVSFVPAAAVSSMVIQSIGTYGLVVNEGSSSTKRVYLHNDEHAINGKVIDDATVEYGPVCEAIPNSVRPFTTLATSTSPVWPSLGLSRL